MKLKTLKTARKRITNITKNGILMRRKLSTQHLTTGKSKRALQGSTKKVAIHKADAKKIKKLIP